MNVCFLLNPVLTLAFLPLQSIVSKIGAIGLFLVLKGNVCRCKMVENNFIQIIITQTVLRLRKPLQQYAGESDNEYIIFHLIKLFRAQTYIKLGYPNF